MITVDSRIGSAELFKLFPSGTAKVGTLAFGDFAFMGNGPTGPLFIGVERKTISDLITSLNTDRFIGHQLPGLSNMYHRVYLVIEGYARPSPRDHVLEWRVNGEWECQTHNASSKPIMYSDFIGRLHTLTEMANVRVIHTDKPITTVQHILALKRWWDKPWDQHMSLCAIYEPLPVTMAKPSLKRRFINVIPGIGWERSKAVADHFRSIAAMVAADVKEWATIEGVGKGIAKRAYDTLHNEM